MKQRIQLVKELREMTNLPIGECQKILQEANWNMENIKDLVSEHQQKMARKKADRVTQEGRFFLTTKNSKLFYIFLACETDFVSSNEDFLKLGNEIVERFSNGENDFSDLLLKSVKFGEKIMIGEEEIEGNITQKMGFCDFSQFYCHNGNKLAIVKTDSNNDELNKKICFHIVSMCNVFDMSSLESLLNQPWFENESKTLKEHLTNHQVNILEFKCFN